MNRNVEFITHPLIKDNVIERRMYQVSIAATALVKNTLVVLPTGLGKTIIAALTIASRLLNESGKVLFLAPTKPLVEQHASFLRRTLKINSSEIVALSGEIEPEKRADLWETARVVVSTPQVIENDLLAGRISLENVIITIFDEAHRAVGNYPYVYIAREYLKQSKNPLILGITASPGSDVERIREVVNNLFIRALEVRSELSEDVRPYIARKDLEWVKVEIPKEMKEIRNKIEDIIKIRINRLRKFGIEVENYTKKELLALQETLQSEIQEKPELMEAISLLAEILKLAHAVELVETQGVSALRKYLRKLLREASSRGSSKAAKNIANDPVFRSMVLSALKCKVEHPKIEKLKEIVMDQLGKNRDSRIIVFTNFRDTADMLARELSEIAPTTRFVGQTSKESDKGMKQREQVEIINKFRRGEYKILVATSVGEEGLDIPMTDLVVFYEAVPSEIRAIQRKGRTGRGREGRIVVLITRGTRDEAYYYTSLRKERMMYEKLIEIKRDLEGKLQRRLEEFYPRSQGLKIVVDARELRSEVVKHLKELGTDIEVKNLDIGDYLLSDRVVVERKTVQDFVESIIAKERLFSQIMKLKSYPRPVLVIEGKNIYGRVHPNAIRGAIASIAVDFAIPIIWTSNPKETAEYLIAIAKREQEYKKREILEHTGKTKRTLKEEQEYIVSSISNVGVAIARNLLEHFQTIENIATASEEELMKVPKIGKKIASRIRRVMSTPYSEAEFYDSETF